MNASLTYTAELHLVEGKLILTESPDSFRQQIHTISIEHRVVGRILRHLLAGSLQTPRTLRNEIRYLTPTWESPICGEMWRNSAVLVRRELVLEIGYYESSKKPHQH